MKLGAHMSIAGGVENAPSRAVESGCEALQIFTKNANRWFAKPFREGQVERFRAELESAEIEGRHAVAHDSYLINLASANTILHEKSVNAFMDEYRRTEALGLAGLVFHPGAAGKSKEDDALRLVGRTLEYILSATEGFSARLFIETTAGQGTNLGWNFEQIAFIIDESGKYSDRIGVCIDTCHIFAAGYDFSDYEKYTALIEKLDSVIGLEKVAAFHLNDSKKGLGSRIDRHAHIGKGEIGLEPFGFWLNDDRFADLPGLLETPKVEDGIMMDPVNLEALRSLLV